MPELIAPTLRLQAAWREAHQEWGPGAHEDGFGLLPSDDVDSPAGFATWLTRLTHQSDPAAQLDPGRVHCTYRWIVERDRVLGGIALRHELNDYWLRVGGHIGYGIRPSARRRGLGTWALGQMLGEARKPRPGPGSARLRGRQPCLGQNDRAPRRRPRSHPPHRTGHRTTLLDQDLLTARRAPDLPTATGTPCRVQHHLNCAPRSAVLARYSPDAEASGPRGSGSGGVSIGPPLV